MKRRSAFASFQGVTNKSWFTWSFLVLRLGMGALFLWAGISKLGDWSAAGYLAGATGPFASWFQSLAGSAIVDQLNIWGLILIGSALLLGLLVRPASIFGIVMMLLYYFAHFEQNTEHGFIEYHIVYALVFVVFLAGGAGHVFGLNELASRSLKKKNRFARFLFG